MRLETIDFPNEQQEQEYSNETVKSCRNDRVASFGVEECCEIDVLWDGVCSRSELG
jgi:hypothetical protein